MFNMQDCMQKTEGTIQGNDANLEMVEQMTLVDLCQSALLKTLLWIFIKIKNEVS